MSALVRAVRLSEAAADVGFDWPDVEGVIAKVNEELAELAQAMAAQGPRPRGGPSSPEVAHELGDLLFAVANLARHLGVPPEDALERANGRFERRFAHVERALAASGRQPQDASLAEMEALWVQAKAAEAGSPAGVSQPAACSENEQPPENATTAGNDGGKQQP